MSLSVFLVPVAIGAVTAVVGATQSMDEEMEIKSLSNSEVYFKLETKMKDEAILQETLKNYGSELEQENEEVTSTIGGTQITFHKSDTGTYQAYFHEDIALKDAEQFLDNIHEEYIRIVQQKTYEKLIERASNEGLMFESEETNENESIVLTFEVKE